MHRFSSFWTFWKPFDPIQNLRGVTFWIFNFWQKRGHPNIGLWPQYKVYSVNSVCCCFSSNNKHLIVPGKKLIKGFIFQRDFISNRNHPWSHRRCKLMCTLKRHLSLAAAAVKKANNWAICAGPKTATKKLTGLFFLDCNYYFRQPDARCCCYNMLPFSVSVL